MAILQKNKGTNSLVINRTKSLQFAFNDDYPKSKEQHY
jgi:hypothetical protein